MDTLTSQYTPLELYELILHTIKNSGNGGEVFLTSQSDLFEIKDNQIWLSKLKEVDSVQYEVSTKQLEMYDLYLLFELFENVIDEHLIQKEEL